MNYLGTVSILDRGDAPAQAVIDRNSRSFAERVANETKEELEKVMHRVDNICQNFEMTNELYSDVGSNMEFVSDIAELTEILKDQVKKKKYQAQVTVFVVGFQDVSTQKLKLLQQVNEFFMDSIRVFDDDPPSTPDVDLDDVTHKIDESLDVARGLANRLGDINQDIIEFLLNYAENKAKNKGKKKLEKALQAAKDDLGSLSEKLMAVQSEIEDKEDKMQQLYKQLEIKTLENQKYRSAAEVAKKNLMDSQSLKDDITMREEKIKDMRQVISRLEIDLAQARHSHEQSQNRLENASLETQQKLKELQKGVDGSKMESNEAKREIEKVHESQIKKMLASHSQEIEDMKQQHTEEINNLTEEIESLKDQIFQARFEKSFSDTGTVKHFDYDPSESSVDPSRQSSRQDSRNASRSSGTKTKGKSKPDGRELSNISAASIEHKPSRSKSTLHTVIEDSFDDVFDLKDEAAWANVLSPDVPGRFKQYRKLSQSYINDLEDKLQVTLARMHRKVQTLKGQFQDHKTKWDTEKKILMDQVNQSQTLQKDAEIEADSTINQLENFITEQEKLEQEEAKKRQQLALSANLLSKVVTSEPTVEETSAIPTEDEIQKLMQQTDDAKALASSTEDGADIKTPDIKQFSEEDDLRSSSARSRQSLRSQYRSKIEESKKVAGQRKNKSEALSVSIQEVYNNKEKILDDDPDDYLQSFGYSANGELLPEHPVVQEYLKTYNIGISFKDAVTKTLIDKDMMSASQLLTELEIHKFKQNNKVLPQLEKMTRNMNMVLGEIISLLNGILVSDRDAALSGTMGMSREPTLMTPESGRTPLPTRESFINQGVDNVDNEYVRNLQHQCHLLNKHLDNTTKKHEDQQQHNTVMMMEMQDTINSLQRELSTLGKAPRSATPRVQYNGVVSPETSVMFTRLDAERNAKIMKKAVNDDKLDQNKYKEAVSQMESYISLPAQRLAHIVRKYTHHTRMKYIEDTVQRSRNLDEDVFEILDKMEDLQKQRAKRWAETMDTMGSERLRMASLLMETLDNIENESGIFLIKPMYSYRGRDTQQKYNGKLSRPTKARRNKSAVTDNQSIYGPVNTPAYTPASNIRNIQREVILQEPNMVPTTKGVAISTEPGVAGAAVNWVGTSSKTTWNMSASQSRPFKEEASFQNTPRILELDINRMLIGQNNISSRLSYPITDDRLVNASQNTLRTYVTINRPAVHPKSMDRPQSASGVKDSSAPPSTPQHISSAGVRRNDNLSPKLPSTPPLPPINKHRNSSALSKSHSSSTDNSQMKANRVNSGFTGTTSDDD